MKSLVSGFMRQFIAGFVALAALTVLLGVGYPAAVWLVSRADSSAAEGSVIADRNGCVVGSELLGVDQQVRVSAGRRAAADPYLHTRPAVTGDDPLAAGDPESSGASNLGPNSEDLRDAIDARRTAIAAREGVAPSRVSADAVTVSGSKLDPAISPAYAELQVPRIARATGISEQRVRWVIAANTDRRQFGFLGEPAVNVARVNVDLGLTGPNCR